MLFTNVSCEIKDKKVEQERSYRYIEFGNRENGLFFLSCALKGFDTVNVGFHNKLSIGKSKRDNPKIIYKPDDKDLYMLLMGKKNETINVIPEDINKIEKVLFTRIKDNDDYYHIILVKVLGDENVTFIFDPKEENVTRSYINVNKKFVKTLTEFEEDETTIQAIL